MDKIDRSGPRSVLRWSIVINVIDTRTAANKRVLSDGPLANKSFIVVFS